MAVEIFDRLGAISLPYYKSFKIFMDNKPESQVVCVTVGVNHDGGIDLGLMPKPNADAVEMVRKIEGAGGAFGIFSMFSSFMDGINPKEIEFLKKNNGMSSDSKISPSSASVRGVNLAQLVQIGAVSWETAKAIEADTSKVLGRPLRVADIQTTPHAEQVERSFASQISKAARGLS